jgi:neutral ceramidase
MRISRLLRHCCILLGLTANLFLTVRLQAEEPVFKAGTARRDITPKEPVPMWGYGARHNILSTGTLDPLQATAVVLEAGKNKLAIVGLDLGRSPSERSLQNIRERIKKDAGIEHSFISGSHTHHGPVLELSDERGKGKGTYDATLRYYTQLEDAIVEAIVEANQKLVPAKFATGAVELNGFNRNRHSKIEPKPVDRSLTVMRLDDEVGKTLALVVNFTGHPTNISGAILQFSADYVGPMHTTVEKELGANVVFMQGASGDISVDKGSNADYVGFGQALGREVIKLSSSLKPEVAAKPSLEVREERFRFDSRVDLSNPLVMAAYSVAFFPELIANFADEYKEGIRPRLTVAVLNRETAFVGVSGEFFCQHANRLRERARVKQLFFFGYCNGYHQYFPTIEGAAEGGYGADSQVAPAEVGAGEQMMNTALLRINQLQGKLK